MNSPQKQYRHLLLIPALLCTLSLLLVTAIKVSATVVPQAVSTVSTYPLPHHNEARRSNPSKPSGDNSVSPSALFRLSIDGPTRTELQEPVQMIASVSLISGTLPSGTLLSETLSSDLFPVGYSWDPADNSPVTIRFRSNGITSTGTITWTTAGYKTINVTANSLLGTVTEPYTIAVSARSMAISSMQTTTFAYNKFDGTGIRILVPAQAIDDSIQLNYLPAEATGPANQGFIGQSFELNAWGGQQVLDNYHFEKLVSLSLVYEDSDLGINNGASIHLRRWNGSEWQRIEDNCGRSLGSSHEPADDRMEAEVCRFGQFALFGAAEAIFLPVIQ